MSNFYYIDVTVKVMAETAAEARDKAQQAADKMHGASQGSVVVKSVSEAEQS